MRGTVEQPVLDGSAYFHRATVSSPVIRKPITNLGGTVHVNSNRLRVGSLEGKVSRKGKLSVKGNLPLRTSEGSLGDKLNLKCEVLEVRARNILRCSLIPKCKMIYLYSWFSVRCLCVCVCFCSFPAFPSELEKNLVIKVVRLTLSCKLLDLLCNQTYLGR